MANKTAAELIDVLEQRAFDHNKKLSPELTAARWNQECGSQVVEKEEAI